MPTALAKLDCLFGGEVSKLTRLEGGAGRPGVGMASKGTLVGGDFLRSEALPRKERDETEEPDGESGIESATSGVPGESGRLVLVTSREKRGPRRGLGAGVDRKL